MSEYEQLVSRLEHIDKAFIVRRHLKLHYAKQMPTEVSKQYVKVISRYLEFFRTYEESLLWYISIELHSRFLAGSERGLYRYISRLNDAIREDFKDKLSRLTNKHSEVICHIKTQRDKYFAHADSVDWSDFPDLIDNELENLLNDLKKLLNEVGENTNESRRVTPYQKLAEEHTSSVFNDLLSVCEPDLNVDKLSTKYNESVADFLKK